MHVNLCPYTLYALQFYSLFPLVKMGQLIRLPSFISFIIAVAAPAILLDYCLKVLQSRTSILTFLNHSPPPSSHKHSNAITIGVIVTSSILGLLFNIGLVFIIDGSQAQLHTLGAYLILLSFFHFSEYFTTSLTNPSTLHLGSFLLNHSTAYVLAISCSFIEFLIERYYFPGCKEFDYVSVLGLAFALGGELMRKTAMFTAGKSFTHMIASERKPEHHLVTSGIYSIVRHPSYAGWFYWAIGTQLLLKNPLCFFLFAVISHNFFKDRIEYEEEILLKFFGKEYEIYKKRVKLWMPLLN